jgi:alkaline phosphatase D
MTFEFGIASGDLATTSAVLWTRVEPADEVGWEIEGIDEELRQHGVCRADDGGFVHVKVVDLIPGKRWRYRFSAEGQMSPWGYFRTLPNEGPVRFAVVSCAKYNSGFFNAYDAVSQRQDLDFVLHLGDYIYEAAQVPRGKQTPGIDIGRPFDPPHDCVSLEDYSRRYAQYRTDPALRRLHEAHGLVFTLDDHEIADNSWSGGAEEHLDIDGPWDRRLHNALTAWEAWQPTVRDPSKGGPLWQILPLGDVATLFLSDPRLHRTDPFAIDGPEKSILGGAQAAVLIETMQATDDKWFVVGMPSKFFSLQDARGDSDTDLVLQTLKLSDGSGNPYHDRWDAFAHERDGILEKLGDLRTQAVLLCGDVHFASFSQTRTGRVSECVTTSVTSPNFDDKMGWPQGGKSRAYEQKMISLVPELEWCDLDSHGYLIVEISAATFTCEWWAVSTVVEPSSDTEMVHSVVLSREGSS